MTPGSGWSTSARARAAALLSLAALAVGCAENAGEGATREAQDALTIEVDDGAFAYSFAERDALPHGIGGDERFVFVTEPLAGRVVVLNRLTGKEVALLPPPPGGFLLPFTLKVPSSGKLFVLDAGGFPSLSTFPVPAVYEYSYKSKPNGKNFQAELKRAVHFDGIPFIFSEDLAVLPDGGVVVSDSGFGQLFLVEPSGAIVPAVTPASYSPADTIPALGPCLFPSGVTVGSVPFALAGDFAPGVGSLTAKGGQLYFGSTCQGGIARIPVASLRDARAPWQRAADIAPVSPKPADVLAETLKGLAFNNWTGDPDLYVTDPIHQRLLRIDVSTGERDVVADEPSLFNFGVAAQFLPPVLGVTPLVVSSDQEHLLASLNVAIPADQFELPFVLTKVLLLEP